VAKLYIEIKKFEFVAKTNNKKESIIDNKTFFLLKIKKI